MTPGAVARVLALAARDVRAAFVSPLAWIVLSIAGAVAAAAFFLGGFEEARPATLRTPILAAGWALLATAPAISMRSFSEEFRLKTWEVLFASPMSAVELVLGKALACAALVACAVAPVGLLAIPLEFHSAPDYGEIACGLLGLFLAGFAAASLGIAVSTTTASQAVAFLGAFFLWLALVAGSRVLVGALPLDLAPVGAALDPLRRLEGFALGLFDSASVAYFLAISAVALAAAGVRLERLRGDGGGGRARRLAAALEAPLFVASVLVAAVAFVALASRDAVRVELDATKTRAYSLAPSTEALLSGLDGDWKVLLFVDGSAADPAVLRQVDEVLERFREANPRIDARRIDPADPASAGAFEAALASLVASRAGDVARIERSVAAALGAFDRLRTRSAGEAAALRAAASQLPAESPVRRGIEQLAGLFAQISTDGGQFRDKVVGMTRSSASRPIPDLEGARSALAAAFRLWSDQLSSAARLFGEWRGQPAAGAPLPAPVRSVLAARIGVFEEIAVELLGVRQELEALPALEFDALGRELLTGEAAVVAGGGRIAVVPSWRIYPKRRSIEGTDRVTYSWGFRGEEVLVGAIRGIASAAMPEVVFVHCEADMLLRPRQDHLDLAASADALRSAGFGVREWTPGRGERPAAGAGRAQVFVVLPALRRTQLEPTREERLLVDEVVRLVAEGQPVLLTSGRSLLSLLGQPDPWQKVLQPFGLETDGARVVVELVAGEDGTPKPQSWQLVERFPESPLAPRLAGRPLLLNQPMGIRFAEPPPAGVRREIVVEVAPSESRWLADDMRGDGDGVREAPASKRLPAALPVVALAERPREGDRGVQRVAVVGSGGWLLTSVADLSDDLGGGRTALVSPGNRELLLATVAWLSARSDLLDAGLSGREVARIAGLGEAGRLAWGVGLGGTLAFGPMVAGAIVIARRRSRS